MLQHETAEESTPSAHRGARLAAGLGAGLAVALLTIPVATNPVAFWAVAMGFNTLTGLGVLSGICEVPMSAVLLLLTPWALGISVQQLYAWPRSLNWIGWAVATIIAVLNITQLEGLYNPNHVEMAVALIQSAHTLPSLLVVSALALVIGPITEELIFRLYVYEFLKNRTEALLRWKPLEKIGNNNAVLNRTGIVRALATVVSASMFSEIHGDMALFIPLFVAGAAFAILRERYGLATSTATHISLNAISFAATFILPH
jgi:membrane protease YdiL (CAAX protease family)